MTTPPIPKDGETWKEKSGRMRHVEFVENDDDLQDGGRWCLIHYRRPPPAQDSTAVVTLEQWWEWVESKQAFRTERTWRAG